MAEESGIAHRLRIQLEEAQTLLRERGLSGVLERLRQRTLRQEVQRPLRRWNFLMARPIGAPMAPHLIPPHTINWWVPPFERGAGGHTTIFRLVKRLEQAGFRNTIVVQDGQYFGTAQHFESVIRDHYGNLRSKVVVTLDEVPPAQASVATSWLTAYPVRDFQPTAHRCYLVQDFEPWFIPVGSEYAMAETTYRMGFLGITAGDWLARKLAADYGMKTHAFGFSFDRDVYYPPPSRPERANTVFFYARPVTARRAFDLGLLVLAELVRRRPGTRVLFAGGDLSGYEIPFAHENSGVVSVETLASLYQQSDAALVFSLTNASLIPLECMACGTVVVSNDGPSVDWLLPPDAALLVAPTIEAMTDALERVLDDRALRERLRERGLALTRSTSWDREADKVVEVFAELIGRPSVDREAPSDAALALSEASR
jgi:O-antigen biosynthesis protein